MTAYLLCRMNMTVSFQITGHNQSCQLRTGVVRALALLVYYHVFKSYHFRQKYENHTKTIRISGGKGCKKYVVVCDVIQPTCLDGGTYFCTAHTELQTTSQTDTEEKELKITGTLTIIFLSVNSLRFFFFFVFFYTIIIFLFTWRWQFFNCLHIFCKCPCVLLVQISQNHTKTYRFRRHPYVNVSYNFFITAKPLDRKSVV